MRKPIVAFSLLISLFLSFSAAAAYKQTLEIQVNEKSSHPALAAMESCITTTDWVNYEICTKSGSASKTYDHGPKNWYLTSKNSRHQANGGWVPTKHVYEGKCDNFKNNKQRTLDESGKLVLTLDRYVEITGNDVSTLKVIYRNCNTNWIPSE